ncbi:TetR/AcrR family transcriptional regulator [Nocardiopsis sp. HUAS JQ3]|uniref:TetR/AcrR family transcriptional regulator n=1 Tax=Nocardiopsis sp. HUAS JQ3 TaxID=3061629 RepID=UPI0023A95A49|nr:TetR/AcrR family transcriptional regulator [Nocardiopsis sp. HUAS JQ3]WDZ93233.1 TetR/AcrR family transcriptional regulator [Nocardiopsis sp. HUAS JQ3]
MQPVDSGDGEARRSFIEEARRGQIVRAAVETIAEEGYARASFVRIAARASVSPGLITYHFRTKERLLRQVLEYVNARLDRAMEGGPEPLAGFEDALTRIVTGHVMHCSRHPREMAVRQEIGGADVPASVREWIARSQDSGRAELVGFLTEGQSHGEFRAFDPEVFTDTLFAALNAVPGRLRRRPVEEHEEYARELALMFAAAATERVPSA